MRRFREIEWNRGDAVSRFSGDLRFPPVLMCWAWPRGNGRERQAVPFHLMAGKSEFGERSRGDGDGRD